MQVAHISNFVFKTHPYTHQICAFERSAERECFALTMEQGTGKTKIVLDSAAYLYAQGRLDALLILAPNGVHRNWVEREIPAHLPDFIPRTCAVWQSTASAAARKAYAALYEPRAHNTLRVLAINIEAMQYPRIQKEANLFCDTSQRCMIVVDESTSIKNPHSIRTKAVLALRRKAAYRRILTGTPVTQSPLDIFTQYSFLSPEILHTESFTVFRARYAELMTPDHPLMQHILRQTGARRAPILIARDKQGHPIYKNLDELKALVAPYTERVLKRDCLDLPPKIYVRRSVEFAPAQRQAYHQLVNRLKHGLQEGQLAGKPLTRLHAVLYLQRILCGTLPAPMTADGIDRDLFKAPEDNPRIQALLQEIAEAPEDESAIIWCRFRADIASVTHALQAVYGAQSVVNYFGDTSTEDREAAIDRFQSNRARFFVGTAQTGGTGLTLTAAAQVHYYSNSFKLSDRLQSEDRAHRIGQKKSVRYVDYEVPQSVDSKIIDALRNKKDIADVITGDAFTAWLDHDHDR